MEPGRNDNVTSKKYETRLVGTGRDCGANLVMMPMEFQCLRTNFNCEQKLPLKSKNLKGYLVKPGLSFSGKMFKKIVFSIKTEVEDRGELNLVSEILPKGLEEKLFLSAQGYPSSDQVVDSSEQKKDFFTYDKGESELVDGNATAIKQEIFCEDLDNLESPSHSNSVTRLSLNDTLEEQLDPTSTVYRLEQLTTEQKPIRCDLCNKTFAKASDLLRHNWSHGKEKPHKCHLCDKGFVQKSNLLIHIRSHSEEKPFKCDVCDKRFLQKSDLFVHHRVHTKEKPYTCLDCNKSFSQISHLQRHKQFHTKEKPFRCNVCDKCFAQKADLLTHHRVHTKEKPFICDICEIGFTQRANLIRHKRVHVQEKPFKCDICGKGFIQKSDLQIHNRVHTREKPYQCSVCNKGFAQKANLIRHTTTHRKQKPFKCDLCGKEYADQKSMVKHQEEHTVPHFELQETHVDTSVTSESLSLSDTSQGHVSCDICDQLFPNETELWKHKDENHTTENSYHVVFVGNSL